MVVSNMKDDQWLYFIWWGLVCGLCTFPREFNTMSRHNIVITNEIDTVEEEDELWLPETLGPSVSSIHQTEETQCHIHHFSLLTAINMAWVSFPAIFFLSSFESPVSTVNWVAAHVEGLKAVSYEISWQLGFRMLPDLLF